MIADGDDDALVRSGEDLAGAMRRAAGEMRAADRSARDLSSALSQGLRRAMGDAAFGTGRFGDALRGIARDVARSALTSATSPLRAAVGEGVGGLVSSAVSGLAALTSGGVRAFARGGVVGAPTAFAAGDGGLGVMGEAGPEAILPLARGVDGRLGVRGGGGVHVTLNVTTPDAEGMRRSGGQIAAALARAVARGDRRL